MDETMKRTRIVESAKINGNVIEWVVTYYWTLFGIVTWHKTIKYTEPYP